MTNKVDVKVVQEEESVFSVYISRGPIAGWQLYGQWNCQFAAAEKARLLDIQFNRKKFVPVTIWSNF